MSAAGEGFEVDAERLGTHAAEFDGLAERASRITARLRDVVAGAAPWGGDAVGRSFAAAHTGPANDALDRLGGLAGGLAEVGASFSAAAGAYQTADDSAADDVTGAG
ncbi:hypothetical protein [Prauserella muralis]|uniref:Uncharacterized protein n=1 Tax=Prauserella muralis TaxID=588067 RepID=A0A2V4BB32_9PSEU|nr:hypothetical protein [Prauserella muralis]PXY32356.1 hypothetical protein BAY60_08800 [Prauserella muralis]TWE23960.1 hypothetical protein FHX69_5264 [Prauserella muralis]